MNRVKELYINKAVPALKEKFGYENVMQIPRLEKIVVNMRFTSILNSLLRKYISPPYLAST